MEICVLVFGRPTHWKLSFTDPLLYEIRSSPGVQFISPILFSSIRGLMHGKRVDTCRSVSGYVGELSLFETDGIAFKIEREHVERYKPKDVSRLACFLSSQSPPLIETASSLLDALRTLANNLI